MEAASILSKQGVKVHLFEKENHVAENIANKAFLFPDFSKAADLVEELNNNLKTSEVDLYLGSKIVGMEKENKQWNLKDNQGRDYTVDAVLLASGYKPFDAKRKEELGYRIYNGVITSLDLEGMIMAGKITNSMGEMPKKVVFLQCVGSRDEKSGNHYCSKVCCVTAVKQSIELRKMLPDAEIFIFYMDLRMWGQSFEEMYRKAQEEYYIRFVRGRISEAATTFDGKIQIKSEDTLVGMPLKMTTDLLVLMVGMEASDETKQLAKNLGIQGEYGFMESKDRFLNDNITSQEGLFVAGSCKRPMSIADTLNDSRSATVAIMEYLK